MILPVVVSGRFERKAISRGYSCAEKRFAHEALDLGGEASDGA